MYYALVYFCFLNHKIFLLFQLDLGLWFFSSGWSPLFWPCYMGIALWLLNYIIFCLSPEVAIVGGVLQRGFAGFMQRGDGRGKGGGGVLRFLFNKVASLRTCGFVDGILQHWCFSSVICEIFESTFFDKHLATTAPDSLNFDILLG